MMQGEYGTWMHWLLGAIVLFVLGIVIREKMALGNFKAAGIRPL